MTDPKEDTARALNAAKAIVDGRHPTEDMASILITLDHVIATVLIAAMGGDVKKAFGMLHEGTVPHVEQRIMLFQNRRAKK